MLLVIEAALSCIVSPVLAQDEATDAARSDGRADEAREHFERAKELYAAGKHGAAIAELRRAHDLRPSPRIFRTIAEIAEEARDYATSLQAWRRYRSEMGDRLDATERQLVEARLLSLRGFVSELQVSGGERGARLFVDDELIGELPLAEPILLNAGRHWVRVHKDGLAPYSQVVTVAGGDHARIDVVLERTGRPAAGPPAGAKQRPAGDTGKSRVTRWTWAGFGSAAALGAVGTVTGVLALRADEHSRDRAFVGLEPPADMTKDLQEARKLGVATDVLWGAAVTTALVTTYFTWLHPKNESGTNGGVRAGLGPGQAWVAGAF